MFVELHIIQNFGPSCLNRDDTNTPKDCVFGGFRRARISSQCLKSAIREYFNSQLEEFNGKLGVRTRMLPKKVIDLLASKGKDENEATQIVKTVIGEFGFKTDKKDDKKTEVLLFLNHESPEKITELIEENWDALQKDKIPKAIKEKIGLLFEEIKTVYDPDIALFGRMVASKTDLNVDSACYVAHALSTHKVDMEMDFYTAIDDLQEQEELGAGMMGIVMYNSSCFYRYLVLSAEQLLSNLQGDKDYSVSVIKAFIEAAIHAIPTGKQTSMAAFNKPDFIMISSRTDQPWSLVNAYATPTSIIMKNTNLINQSITQLEQYLQNMIELYGEPKDFKMQFCLTGKRPIKYLDQIGQQQKSIVDLINNTGEVINEHYSTSS